MTGAHLKALADGDGSHLAQSGVRVATPSQPRRVTACADGAPNTTFILICYTKCKPRPGRPATMNQTSIGVLLNGVTGRMGYRPAPASARCWPSASSPGSSCPTARRAAARTRSSPGATQRSSRSWPSDGTAQVSGHDRRRLRARHDVQIYFDAQLTSAREPRRRPPPSPPASTSTPRSRLRRDALCGAGAGPARARRRASSTASSTTSCSCPGCASCGG